MLFLLEFWKMWTLPLGLKLLVIKMINFNWNKIGTRIIFQTFLSLCFSPLRFLPCLGGHCVAAYFWSAPECYLIQWQWHLTNCEPNLSFINLDNSYSKPIQARGMCLLPLSLCPISKCTLDLTKQCKCKRL